MASYDSLDLKGEGKTFGYVIFEELPQIHADLPTQAKIEIKIHEIRHGPLKLDQEEIKKLQQADRQYSELTKNMKTKNETIRGDFSLDSQGVLYKEVQDHGKGFKALQIYVLFEIYNSLSYNGII